MKNIDLINFQNKAHHHNLYIFMFFITVLGTLIYNPLETEL